MPPPIYMPTVQAPPANFIGPYRLVRELGRGGMGVVYLAVRDDGAFRKNVAIKLMLRDQVNSEFLQRFRQERQVLAALDHPNIARILDGGDTPDGMPYYVMDYVDGLPLDKYCDEQGLTVAARIRLFQQVCAAVEYLHQNSILHRDLKPSNILVSSDGIVKLLDFGIAKIVGAAALAAPELTGAQGRPMTPAYASPEQIAGATLQRTSDVYSLGTILYRLLTGRNPFENIDEILAGMATKQQPAPPSQSIKADMKASQDVAHLRRAMAGELDGIVMMALRFDPKQRYQSAADFSRDLQHFLNDEPVTAYHTSAASRSFKMLKRKWAVIAALIAIIALGGFGAWQFRQFQRQKAQNTVLQDKLRLLDQLSSGSQASTSQSVADQIADIEKLRGVLKDYPSMAAKAPEKSPAILEKGVSYLDRMRTPALANAGLGTEVAKTYREIAGLQGRAAALQTYQKAAELLAAASTANPPDPGARDLLAQVSGQIERLGGPAMKTPAAQVPPPAAVTTQQRSVPSSPPVRPRVSSQPAHTEVPVIPPAPAVTTPAPAPTPAAPPAAPTVSPELQDRLADVTAKVEGAEQSIKPFRDDLKSRGQDLNADTLSAMVRMRTSLAAAKRNMASGNESAAQENLGIAEELARRVMRTIGR